MREISTTAAIVAAASELLKEQYNKIQVSEAHATVILRIMML